MPNVGELVLGVVVLEPFLRWVEPPDRTSFVSVHLPHQLLLHSRRRGTDLPRVQCAVPVGIEFVRGDSKNVDTFKSHGGARFPRIVLRRGLALKIEDTIEEWVVVGMVCVRKNRCFQIFHKGAPKFNSNSNNICTGVWVYMYIGYKHRRLISK